MSDEEIKDRLKQDSIRMSELQLIAKSLGIDVAKARSKKAICEVLCQPANLLLLQARPELVPEWRPDPKEIKAEAERKKIEADAEAERKKAEADAKALRIQQKREALDTSTKFNRTMGFTFVALMFYILLIVVSTTDLQLFLPESTVRLPIVEVELPLLGFYSVVPFLILVFHFHLLINLKHHNDKYRDWRTEAGDDAKEASLDPILINFKDAYHNPNHPFRILIVLVVSLSVFYFPLVNLTLMQWRFGDYHDFWISTFQWFATLLDTALILGFFSIIGLDGTEKHRFTMLSRIARRLPLAGVSVFGIVVWLLALKLRLMLERPNAMPFPPSSWIPTIDLSNSIESVNDISDDYVMHNKRDSLDAEKTRQKTQVKFEDPINLMERDFRFAKLMQLDLSQARFQRCNLDFANFFLTTMEEGFITGSTVRSTDFRYCNLVNTDFISTDLNESNFFNANLNGARFIKSSLNKARLDNTNLENASFASVSLKNARLNNANLKKIQIEKSDLDGANFSYANLERGEISGADLQGTKFKGTNLDSANVKLTNFAGVDLQNATFNDADLRVANFERANLKGANLTRAILKNAVLRGANLQNASLKDADLRAAILENANLENANLENANLEGANREGANIKGTILEKSK